MHSNHRKYILMGLVLLLLTGCGTKSSDTSTSSRSSTAEAGSVTQGGAEKTSGKTEDGAEKTSGTTQGSEEKSSGTSDTPATTESAPGSPAPVEGEVEVTAHGSYTHISQETAAEMMQRDDGHVIVDVRRQDEYDSGHIPGAIMVTNENIGDEQPSQLPDYDQIILVYCRSGKRSKEASEKLANLGYRNVYEFGGLLTWNGEIVAEPGKEEKADMHLYIGEQEVDVTWQDNKSVDALRLLLPLEIEMSMYSDFEQVGPLGHTILSEDEKITAEYGDIVLYSGDQIVIFYGSNTWEYTRLGHVHMTEEALRELLANGNVTLRITE